jgi:hypothetical protein
LKNINLAFFVLCLTLSFPISAKSPLVSWNINPVRWEQSAPITSPYERAMTFIQLPSPDQNNHHLLLTNERALVIDQQGAEDIHWPSCLDLNLFARSTKIAALRSNGTQLLIASCNHLKEYRIVSIPTNFSFKSISIYERATDGRLFLFGLNSSAREITQFEVVGDWQKLKPIKTITSNPDFQEKIQQILCDDEFGFLYVLGSEGSLSCYGAEPSSSANVVHILQKNSGHKSSWILFKVEENSQNGSIVLLETETMIATIWPRAQSNLLSKKTLALLCPPLLAFSQNLEMNSSNQEVSALDRQGKIHYLSVKDFIIKEKN